MGGSIHQLEPVQNPRVSFREPLRMVFFFLLAAIAAASMWFYVTGILRAHQIIDAHAREIPRGNLSDLYPRWLGARELLLHHRNPYGREVTLEIQQGYYGRRLDAGRANDPKDQQGFAYPVYVVFLLAPLVGIPFHFVQVVFYWLLACLTALSVWLWLRALNWNMRRANIAIIALLMLGSVPAVQGLKLQQLTLLVAALLSGSVACIASGFLFCGGALLALATIKPQLTWLLAAWLILWSVADWRIRRRFLFGFAFFMALLLVGAEVILPGWLTMFVAALREYHQYTQNQSVLDQLAPWFDAGKLLAVLAIAISALTLSRLRRAPANVPHFGRAIALVTALTVLVMPMFSPYNQVLLLPAILLLVRDRRKLAFSASRGVRFVYAAGAFALSWQWIASLGLSAVYLISPDAALSGWKWPFFATFALPVLVFALSLVDVQSSLRSSILAEHEVDGSQKHD